jgi:outer membrane protein OmpA-like peptidoglycan-associated protein
MSEFTGGKFYKAYSKEELLAVFRDIYNSLRNYYLVSYKPPEFWGFHKAFLTLDIPGRDSTLIADAEYNTAGINPFTADNDVFKRPILFEFDSSAIKKESLYILDEITDVLLVYPKVRLEIQGHTDSKGEIDYNQRLSDRRAKAVMDALLSRGIHERRLRSRGFGESVPIAPNDSEENMAKNRRTEFVIIAK